jgi:putative ABC transport system permease protein
MTFEQWRQDLQLAWRGLRRAKGFTATAVLTLAMGIAGASVIFALIEGVLLRPLPVHEQDRLLVAWKELRSAGFAHYPFRMAEIDRLSKEGRLFESVAGVDYNGAQPWVVVENGSATFVQSAAITGDFFGVLGVKPLLGRALNRTDDVIGAENVIVISHGLWQRRYGGTRDVIGRGLTLRERRFTIVGVMPAGFEYPRGSEAWVSMTALTATIIDPDYTPLVDLIARLHRGATIEQAASELGLIARLESEAPPGATQGLTPVVRSYEDVVVGDVRLTLFVLFAAVGLVLLIASANVANLLLMRGEGRRAEMAIRSTLGASRSRLARQMLAESVVLALASGAAGLALTWWGLSALIALVPDGLPRVDAIRLDAGVLGFAMAIAVITSVLAGMVPAVSASRIDLVSQSRHGGGMRGSGARHGRRTLVVFQVALAITVVAAAGLLTRSVLQLEAADMGLTAEELVLVQLALPQAKYVERDRRLQFLDDVVKELEATPGIAGATPVNTPPFAGTGGWDAATFTVEGQSADRAGANSSLNLESIHPNYFATVGVSLTRGRRFGPADREGAPNVVIVSEDVAARTWPGEEPIGKRLKLGGATSEGPWWTVVGVARMTRYRELREPRATVYLPAAQFMFAADAIVLRSTAPARVVAGAARERIRAVDPAVQVMRVTPFADLLDRPLARPRFDAFVLGVFGIAALMLAAIGLYAVIGAYVRQRNTEIGIRVALGATALDVRRLVVGEGLWLAGLGAVIGLAGAVATTRLLRGLLFGVHPLDAVSLLAAVLLVVAASVLASYLPASRAARVDPRTLLRAG